MSYKPVPNATCSTFYTDNSTVDSSLLNILLTKHLVPMVFLVFLCSISAACFLFLGLLSLAEQNTSRNDEFTISKSTKALVKSTIKGMKEDDILKGRGSIEYDVTEMYEFDEDDILAISVEYEKLTMHTNINLFNVLSQQRPIVVVLICMFGFVSTSMIVFIVEYYIVPLYLLKTGIYAVRSVFTPK
ncbi:hypothetical protein NEMIN01_0490 [Nematocida minor]|uniref:uncharacterized protein n=1 Tax=Nematocida minor TaxID=1912983 RepID=UPI00221F6558|nr:uncharacterized protein NEMIN01_0490 [Nematocida minor]KAI5189427.1 hypothetical protein NEMIN01_0490 [Nematocida minor]